jgi:hypothetical protein
MTLGIQRGLSSSFSAAHNDRRAHEVRGLDAAKATPEASSSPAAAPVAAAAPAAVKASEETVQGARSRALGIEDQMRQRLDQGWVEAHHRKGHGTTYTGW